MSKKMFADMKPSSNTIMFDSVKNDPLSNQNTSKKTSNQKLKQQQ
jgi:hypothetical protein